MLIKQVRPVDLHRIDPSNESLTDIRVTGERIAAIGPGLAREPGEEVLDGGGAVAIPGLWDQHIHSGQLAQAHSRLDTSGAESVAQLLECVRCALAGRDAVDSREPVALVGFGHRLVDLVVQPTVPMLDAVTGEVPTVLIGGDAHHAWVNSAALRALGVPPRDGLLAEAGWFEQAGRLTVLPGVGEQIAAGMSMLQRRSLERGVVGVVDMEWGCNWRTWLTHGASMHVRTAVYPADLPEAPGPSGTVLDDSGLVRMGPVKIILDGALGSRSAYTRGEYLDGGGNPSRGVLSVDPEELAQVLADAQARGLTAAVHAIGDAAAAIAMDAITDVGLRARIEHAQMLTDDDIAQMARSGIAASVQPAHLLDDRDTTEDMWAGRAHQAFRLRDLLDAGVELQLGSDAPVAPLDPWLAMAAAVHRSADEREAWYPRQQIQPREALAASTDGVKGLEVGGPGDVALLSEDVFEDVPLTADGVMVDSAAREAAHRLREARVLATVVAGRLAAQPSIRHR